MSIETEVSSMIENIKKDYKAIENLGATIPEDKNIENIASCLEEVYDNLPKTTGEETNLSLNTIKGKMNTTLKGDTQQDGTPTPSTPIDIEVVTGTQEVKVENKNLLKFKQAKEVTTSGVTIKFDNNTTLTLNGTSNGQVAWGCELEPLKLVGTYKASGYTRNDNFVDLYWKDKNGTIQFAHLKNNPTITFNEGDTLYQIFVYMVSGTTATFNNETFNLQLEKGTTATTYTPHQEQTQTISLGDIELCKIGNYQDYLYKSNGKWYKKENIGKYTFTGNENWFKHSTTSNNLFYISPVYNPIARNMKKPSTNNVALECYSEMAQYKAVNTMAGNSVIGINPSVAGDIYVGTSLSGISDRDVFKTYLQNHVTNFYYILITANDIEITNTTLIEQLDNLEKAQSYNGTTNISSSGNLSAILSVSALKGE